MNMKKEYDGKRIFIGFDGYIDQILKPCRTHDEYFTDIRNFGTYLADQGGNSFTIPVHTIVEKSGGNMPNMARALSQLGFAPVCIGALGYPQILPQFRDMEEECELYSVANPGKCDAFEFSDGKIMFAKNQDIDELDYQMICRRVPVDKQIEIFSRCDAYAFLNWGEMHRSNDILRHFLKQVIPFSNMEGKYLLIDFSDFSSKSDDEVDEMLEIIRSMGRHSRVCISMNKHETSMFAKHFQMGDDAEPEEVLEELSMRVHPELVCVHLLEKTIYVTESVVHSADKEIVDDPKVITGGGDNFNAGLLAGLMNRKSVKEAIEIANMAAYIYARDGRLSSFREFQIS